MAITKSAKKALRRDQKRRTKNTRQKNILKDFLKEVAVLVSQNKKEEAKTLLPKVYKLLDKAAKTGIIKKNKASRKKSRISRLVS